MLEDQANSPSAPSRIFNNKTRLVVVAAVLALAIGYLVFAAFPGSTLYYLTVDEFLADEQNLDGRNIRVVGKLIPESFERVSGTVQANFTMTQEGKLLNATYDGVLP